VRRLAIFDIDGTLTDTNSVEDECFDAAVTSVLGLAVECLDWSEAPHITDASLVQWLCEKYCHRSLRRAEAVAVQYRFVELLETQIQASPDRFQAIPGSSAALEYLSETGWDVALATGCWSETARLKLRAAGLSAVEKFPFASVSDAMTRQEIMHLAASSASARTRRQVFSRIVSVGDAVWDVRAAASVGWPFVGIAVGERALALRDAGAHAVLPDLSGVDAFTSRNSANASCA
jgi:phosphoglycolate phosphatase-like HAD superfamily hydrolase